MIILPCTDRELHTQGKGKSALAPENAMKKIAFALCAACMLLFGVTGNALADNIPITASVELSQTEIDQPCQIDVTISISNAGDKDLPGPVYLYYPDGKAVMEFGDGGAVQLAAGDFASWSGKWQVTQKQLEEGRLTFAAKFPDTDENGETVFKSIYFSESIAYKPADDNEARKNNDTNTAQSGVPRAVFAGLILLALLYTIN
jgi:hypothetical protein